MEKKDLPSQAQPDLSRVTPEFDANLQLQPGQSFFNKEKKPFGFELILTNAHAQVVRQPEKNRMKLEHHWMAPCDRAKIHTLIRNPKKRCSSLLSKGDLVLGHSNALMINHSAVKMITWFKKKGFRVVVNVSKMLHHNTLLNDLADIIKINFREHNIADIGRFVIKYKPKNHVLLIDNIETHNEFEHCKQLGFELFQGKYFQQSQPVTK